MDGFRSEGLNEEAAQNELLNPQAGEIAEKHRMVNAATGQLPRSVPAELAKRHLVIELGTGKSRPVVSRAPVLSTVGSNWHGVSLEQHRGGPVETLDFVAPHHVIVVQLEQTAHCEFRNGFGSFRPQRLDPGQVIIFPAMTPHSVRTGDIGEFLAVRLDPQFVLCAAHELIGVSELELMTGFAVSDPFLAAGALALKAEAEAGSPTGRIYAESLASAMAMHLVRHHSTRRESAVVSKGGLTGNQLGRVIDFIHVHLEQDISLSALSASVDLSPYHFARLFKRSTGLAPHQFVIRCRVQKAKELLLAQHALAEVALKVGFSGQSHLATHFKRAYGVTPGSFRQQMLPRKLR